MDEDRWKIRKVEIFADKYNGLRSRMSGRQGCADHLGSGASTTLKEIAADPEFLPEEISRAEFEAVWIQATGNRRMD